MAKVYSLKKALQALSTEEIGEAIRCISPLSLTKGMHAFADATDNIGLNRSKSDEEYFNSLEQANQTWEALKDWEKQRINSFLIHHAMKKEEGGG